MISPEWLPFRAASDELRLDPFSAALRGFAQRHPKTRDPYASTNLQNVTHTTIRCLRRCSLCLGSVSVPLGLFWNFSTQSSIHQKVLTEKKSESPPRIPGVLAVHRSLERRRTPSNCVLEMGIPRHRDVYPRASDLGTLRSRCPID